MIDNRCLIIAEAGVNHNGNFDTAKELCLAAKEAGADVVKFQTWITDKIITRDVAQAEYQLNNTGKDQSQYDMLKALELSFDEFVKIKEYCDEDRNFICFNGRRAGMFGVFTGYRNAFY